MPLAISLDLSMPDAILARMAEPFIPYSSPPVVDSEIKYLQEVLQSRHFRGDGSFTKRCNQWLEKSTGSRHALLTHSCTAALEMSALLLDLRPGDEVIMPSFNFVSSANAVALRGATPVFVDIRPDTLNIDEEKILPAITAKTKAVCVVHYAGVGCAMEKILPLAKDRPKDRQIAVIEDAAQCLLANYQGRPLGTFGALGCLSFHDTKNIVSGEGGALLVNDEKLAERAEIIREKGTNRAQFFRGQVDKYTWVDIGSSFLPSEFIAAVLFAQLEQAQALTAERVRIWAWFHQAFAGLEAEGKFRRPTVPKECQANGHIYYLICRNLQERMALIQHLKTAGIGAPFHYVPLHTAPAGLRYGRTHGSMAVTENTSDCLLRMPLWNGMTEQHLGRIAESVHEFYRQKT